MQAVFAGQCVGLTSILHTTIGKNPRRITLRESNISLRGMPPHFCYREQASCCSSGCLCLLAMKSTLPYDCCSQLSQTKHGNWVYELRERLSIRLSATAIYTSICTTYNLHSTNTDLSASSDIGGPHWTWLPCNQTADNAYTGMDIIICVAVPHCYTHARVTSAN